MFDRRILSGIISHCGSRRDHFDLGRFICHRPGIIEGESRYKSSGGIVDDDFPVAFFHHPGFQEQQHGHEEPDDGGKNSYAGNKNQNEIPEKSINAIAIRPVTIIVRP